MMRVGAVLARSLIAAGLLLGGNCVAPAAGALVIGACGAYGVAYDYARSAVAATEAMHACRGRGCRVVAQIRRGCAAFAVDGRNFCGAYGFSSGPRLGPAQNNALRECYHNGGKDCVIRAFVCDAKG